MGDALGRLTEERSTIFGQKIRLASRRTGSQGVVHTHSPANQDAEAKKKKDTFPTWAA